MLIVTSIDWERIRMKQINIISNNQLPVPTMISKFKVLWKPNKTINNQTCKLKTGKNTCKPCRKGPSGYQQKNLPKPSSLPRQIEHVLSSEPRNIEVVSHWMDILQTTRVCCVPTSQLSA